MAYKQTTISEEELCAIAELPSVSGTQTDRFVQHCLQYYSEWTEAHEARIRNSEIDVDQSLLLIYAEVPSVSLEIKNEQSFIKEKRRRATCSLESGAAVASETLGEIFSITPSFANVDQAVDFIEANLTEDSTFVLLLLSRQEAWVHRREQDIREWIDTPNKHRLHVCMGDINPDIVAQSLLEFHEDGTKTHRCATAKFMWDLKKHNRFLNHPEARIQGSLVTHLRAYFRHASAFVNEEAHSAGGRTDICIQRTERRGRTEVSKTTMLELKVLKPDKNQQWNDDWARQGITQAKGYRRDNTDATFACLYDARINQVSMDGLGEFAQKNDVRLEIYPMQLPPPPKAPKRRTAATTKKSTSPKARAKKASTKRVG